MDELEQLESLNLIAKVCTELETHIGISDKVLGTQRYKIFLLFNFPL